MIRDTNICLCFPYDMFAIADKTHERKQNEWKLVCHRGCVTAHERIEGRLCGHCMCQCGVVSVTWRTFSFDILSSTHFASLIALNGNIRLFKQKLRQITSKSNHWILTEIRHIDVLYAFIIVYKICVCVSLYVILLLKIMFLVSYFSNIFPHFSHPLSSHNKKFSEIHNCVTHSCVQAHACPFCCMKL